MAKKTVTISRKPSGAGEETTATEGLNALPPGLESAAAERGEPSERTTISSEVCDGPGPVGCAVYNTVYCVSYGVVFSALMIGKLIPGSGLIGRALRDGASSARQNFDERQEAAVSQVPHPASA
jgi:hypothetical protein